MRDSLFLENHGCLFSWSCREFVFKFINFRSVFFFQHLEIRHNWSMSFIKQCRMKNGPMSAVHLLIDLIMKRVHLTIANSKLQTSFSFFKLLIIISWFCIVAWESVSIAFMSASWLLSSAFSLFNSRSVSSQSVCDRKKNRLKSGQFSGEKPLIFNQDPSACNKNSIIQKNMCQSRDP